MSSFFGFGSSSSAVTARFQMEGEEERQRLKCRRLGSSGYEELPLYTTLEPIVGKVCIEMLPGKKVEHQGIKIECIGSLQLYGDSGGSTPKDKVRFNYLVKELRPAGTLFQSETHPFEFNVERIHETYRGKCLSLRYFLRLTISRGYTNTVQEYDIAVQNPPSPSSTSALLTHTVATPTTVMAATSAENEAPEGIRMEVGIEDCLHIEFEFDKSKYSLKDVVLGKIHFVLVRIKIKHMELAILRRENAKLGANTYASNENITKFELMDGAPIKGETIPVRLFLSPLDISPTYRTVANCASIKYYLNLVLIDEEDRRYFKQHEITFYRGDESG